MSNKIFYSIIWGYHEQICHFPKIQNYHLHPLEVAKKLGYDVRVISLDNKFPPEEDPNFPKDVPVYRFISTFQYLKFLIKNRDSAYYVNTITMKTLIVGLLVKRSIFIPHSAIFGSNKFKKKIIATFYRFFTKIRVNNPAEAHVINRLKADLAEIIPLVIDTSTIIPPKEHPNFILLSLGNLIPVKHPEVLLEALSITKSKGHSFKLITIGEDKLVANGYKENYKELIEKFGLHDDVSYLGYLSLEDARQYIERATIYVNMSSGEGLCIALYDSICSGLGAILPEIVSFEGVFGDNAYMYESGDVRSLAYTIIQAYEERKDIPKKVTNMQTIVKAGYNHENITRKLMHFFQKTYEDSL